MISFKVRRGVKLTVVNVDLELVHDADPELRWQGSATLAPPINGTSAISMQEATPTGVLNGLGGQVRELMIAEDV